jgi:hypothetical protein
MPNEPMSEEQFVKALRDLVIPQRIETQEAKMYGLVATYRLALAQPAQGTQALVEALQRIERWHGEFPDTGQFWDYKRTDPMSYKAVNGTDGERDYMRQVARDALAAVKGAEPVDGPFSLDPETGFDKPVDEPWTKSEDRMPELHHTVLVRRIGNTMTRQCYPTIVDGFVCWGENDYDTNSTDLHEIAGTEWRPAREEG